MNQKLSETVPAALRAELARREIAKGEFARRIGHDETWLYRRLTGRTPLTLSDLDLVCQELALDPGALLAAAPAQTAPKKTIAGRSTGRRSRTQPPSGEGK